MTDKHVPPVAACLTFSLPAKSTSVREDILTAPVLVSDASSSTSPLSLLSTTSLGIVGKEMTQTRKIFIKKRSKMATRYQL